MFFKNCSSIGAMTLIVTTFGKTTLSIPIKNVTLSATAFATVIQIVIMLSVANQPIIQTVIMLNDLIQNVVAPLTAQTRITKIIYENLIIFPKFKMVLK